MSQHPYTIHNPMARLRVQLKHATPWAKLAKADINLIHHAAQAWNPSTGFKARQQKQADHYDKTTKPLPPVNSEDPDPFMMYVPPIEQYRNSYAVANAPFDPSLPVHVRLPGSITWSLGVCKNQVAPRSYLVECNGTAYQRNHHHIKKANTTASLISQNAVTCTIMEKRERDSRN